LQSVDEAGAEPSMSVDAVAARSGSEQNYGTEKAMRRIMSSNGRGATRGVAAILTALCALALAASTASAAKVYKNLPAGKVKDTESECMNGCGHTSFGVEVQLAGRDRYITAVTGVLSSFSCEEGVYSNNTCETEPGATYNELVTLRIYEPILNEPGALLGEFKGTYPVPYKPEPNVHGCVNHGEGSGWGPECHIGDLAKVKFEHLPSVFEASGRAILELAVPEDESSHDHNKSGDPNVVNVATATPFNGVKYEYEAIPAPSKGSDPYGAEVIFGTEAHPEGESVASTAEAPGSVPAFEVFAVRR
jgi:hypothetical protein